MLELVPDEDDIDGTGIISSTSHFCKVVSVYYVCEPTHLLPMYASISMIDWIGARDANCPWPGVLSFVKLSR